MKTFKTPMGTELPLLNLKGKDYLTVAYRILWMREEHGDWGIETEFLELSPQSAVAKASIKDGSGRVLAQGTKHEAASNFPDHIEKAESGAIGRALALCGYGTQFALEMDEGARIVDAPQSKAPPSAQNQAVAGDSGSFVLPFGKYKGQKLSAIGAHDLDNYLTWMRSNKKAGEEDSPAMVHIEAYLKTREVKK